MLQAFCSGFTEKIRERDISVPRRQSMLQDDICKLQLGCVGCPRRISEINPPAMYDVVGGHWIETGKKNNNFEKNIFSGATGVKVSNALNV